MNLDIDDAKVHPLPQSDDFEWGQYPQSLFGNWTSEQVNRCQMLTKCSDRELSSIYRIRVLNDGTFDKHVEKRTVRKDDPTDLRAYWSHLGNPVSVLLVAYSEAEAAVIAMLECPSAGDFCRGYDVAHPPNARNKVCKR